MPVSFEEEKRDERFSGLEDPRLKESKMVGWLIRKGWFATAQKANQFLIFISVLCILLAVVALKHKVVAQIIRDLF